jgi:general secretion pathway protein D
MELTRVVETLSELSVEYDPERIGVNIIPLFNSNDSNPRVNISLRNLNLDRILQFVTQQVNFAYDVGGDAVTIQPSDSLGGSATTVTEFFPISRATVIRLTGFRDGGGSSSGPVDPFAAPSSGASGPSQNEEVEALETFFQSAGVNFEASGASLAFDGEQLIVTQTRRNLERMRTILRNYNEVKQVEIEAKFLEVEQGNLEELGFNWRFNRYSTSNGVNLVGDPEILNQTVIVAGQNGPISTSSPLYKTAGGQYTLDPTDPDVIGRATIQAAVGGVPGFESRTVEGTTNLGGRTLASSFGGSSEVATASITGPTIDKSFDFSAPSLPSAIDLASDATQFFNYAGWNIASGLDLDVAINALARMTSSDLMSAPKVTVLSGKRASITVAQELRYPESYGDIESTAGQGGGGNNSSGSGGISITAGTPQDFVTRNVGVEMSVTPNVENDDTISLILEPRVTEFEGFVEFGGPSIAIGGDGTVATVPAGFYQPIFSTREISTEVTVYDGATLVMGGLTRDDVRSFNDKVPFLGDIPGIGRLFRSEGESRQKRNLLIFITANLVSPGGSPARQNYRNVNANSLFQNPTIMTPSGSANRSIKASAE